MSTHQNRGAIALAYFMAAAGIAALISGISELKAVAEGGARNCGGPLVPLRPHTQASATPIGSSRHAACDLSNSLDGR